MATENTGKSTDTTESAANDDQQQQSSKTADTTNQAKDTTQTNEADTDNASANSDNTAGEDNDSSGDSTQQPEMVSVDLLKTVVNILKPEQSETTEKTTKESLADSSNTNKESDSTDKANSTTEKKVDPQVTALTKQNEALQKVVRDQLLAQVPEALKPLIPEDLVKATEYVQSDAFKTAAVALQPAPATGKKGETGSNNSSESKTEAKTFATLTSTDLDTAFAGVIV